MNLSQPPAPPRRHVRPWGPPIAVVGWSPQTGLAGGVLSDKSPLEHNERASTGPKVVRVQ
jgi:hypothetical protein